MTVSADKTLFTRAIPTGGSCTKALVGSGGWVVVVVEVDAMIVVLVNVVLRLFLYSLFVCSKFKGLIKKDMFECVCVVVRSKVVRFPLLECHITYLLRSRETYDTAGFINSLLAADVDLFCNFQGHSEKIVAR
jgi:hypothetical protein